MGRMPALSRQMGAAARVEPRATHRPAGLMAPMRGRRLSVSAGIAILTAGWNRNRSNPMGIISRARDAIERYRRYDPVQAYLEASTSLVDLEARQREVDRGKFRKGARQF